MELISRRKVLEYMADYHLNNRGIAMDWTEAIDDIFCEVEKMPIIESRPKGKRIDNSEDGYVECPFCHEATNCDDNIGKLHYCWNCGAEMESE